MKLLIADDNTQITSILEEYARKEGYRTVIAHDGGEALRLFALEKPDVVLLDVMMPIKDGFSVCREIRRESSVPILMITARGEDFEKIMGLEIGADDYIVKPFSPGEVMARIKAIMRRIERETAQAQVLVFDDLTVNLDDYTAKINDHAVPLTKKEIEILWTLAATKNKVFRENLLIRCGATTTSATTGRSTATSSDCAPSSMSTDTPRGPSGPSGASAINLRCTKMPRSKIARRLSLYFVMALLVFAIVVGAVFLLLFRNYTVSLHRDKLRGYAESLAGALSVQESGTGSNQFGPYLRFAGEVAEADVWIVDENMEFLTISRGQGMMIGHYNYTELPENAGELIDEVFEGKTAFSESFSGVLSAPTLTVVLRSPIPQATSSVPFSSTLRSKTPPTR